MTARLRATALLLTLGGCCAPRAIAIETAAATNATCNAEASGPRLYHGVYDVYANLPYIPFVVFRNRSDDFTVTGAIVSLEDVDGRSALPGTVAPTKFRVAASAFIAAGTDAAPTEGVGSIPVIPGELIPELASTVLPGESFEMVARVEAYGTNSSGGEVYMDDWLYPMTVCNGCLCATPPPAVSCHPGADEGYAGLYACPL